ncbi:MAG TPA: hypothetical protein VGZ27_18410 [Vicinamibacterales bacterium]|jgi:hypothetical protein|nr:hypothetical protein [Vicinamibacterales bacterium]
MNRYVNIACSCATVALIGLAASPLSAQQPAPTGRGRGRGTPPAAEPARQGGDNIGTNTPGAPSPVPTTVTALGAVHLGKPVKADGQTLPPGTYQMRVTEREAAPAAAGQTPQYERWAEFLQGGQVKGREVAIIVPADAAKQVMKEKFPASGGYRTDVLKGGNYYRVWFNKAGTQYVVYFNI